MNDSESIPHCPSCLCFEKDPDSLFYVSAGSSKDCGSQAGFVASLDEEDQELVRPLAHVNPKDWGVEMGIYGPDPNLDKIEECGPYLLCIRPPSQCTNEDYIIRLYHKDSKEIVIADDPPVKVYQSNCYDPILYCICWWCCSDSSPFYVMYNDRLVCRWGGEEVVKELPYERP